MATAESTIEPTKSKITKEAKKQMLKLIYQQSLSLKLSCHEGYGYEAR